MWAGVHFRAAVTAGAALGTQIGDSVYTFVASTSAEQSDLYRRSACGHYGDIAGVARA